MMGYSTKWCFITVLLAYIDLSMSVELTFELLDNAKDCFFELIETNATVTLEFQVVTGGSYDVDVSLEAPNKEIIYRQLKSQFDSHTFVAPMTGEYAACFSNQFSTFSHKLVYMDFQVNDLPENVFPTHSTVMTQIETSVEKVKKSLVTIADYQTHHKLREAQGRKRAEDLNERVFWWSLLETIVVLTVGIGQVCILKNFFSEKRPLQYTRLS